jgi:hypothetical protein
MPTKTYKRISDQKARPFRPSETELFAMEICGQMAQVLGIPILLTTRTYNTLPYEYRWFRTSRLLVQEREDGFATHSPRGQSVTTRGT